MRTEYRSIFENFFKSYVPDSTNVISQNVAQQAFEHGDLLGKGAYGIVKFCYIDDKPVIVKEFNDDALEIGIPYSEYHAHHAFYKSLKNQCTEYFSKPLNVQINKKSRYTVQAPLHYNSGKNLLNSETLIIKNGSPCDVQKKLNKYKVMLISLKYFFFEYTNAYTKKN